MFYGYTRVSTVEQVNGTSLDEQQNRIRGAALMRGADLGEVFTDGGISGSVALRDRPAGAQLLAALQAADTVVAAKLDRLFRSASDALTMAEELRAKGIDLIIADLGADPVTMNGTSKMFFGMLALMSEFERERIRERQADGIRCKKAKQGFTGGKRPFGYQIHGTGKEAVMVEDSAEQGAIAEIHRLRAKGASYQAIAAKLAEQGHGLSFMTVKRILDRTLDT